MDHVLGVLAVWIVWISLEQAVEMPRLAWYALAAALGIGWELLVEPKYWWLGIGVGGAAALLFLLTDLILVATDAAKVSVLRRTR
jgi:hypothetical protein